MSYLLIGQQGAQAVQLSVYVEGPRAVAALDQVFDNPGADETLGPGDEKSRSTWLRRSVLGHGLALYGLGARSQRHVWAGKKFGRSLEWE